jgi:hypothetical protein
MVIPVKVVLRGTNHFRNWQSKNQNFLLDFNISINIPQCFDSEYQYDKIPYLCIAVFKIDSLFPK